MFQSRIAEWSYGLGCVSAAVAIVYRSLWFVGARLFGAPRLVLDNFVELSILLFVVSIGYSGEGEHQFRKEAERRSGPKVNSSRSEATLAW
jgi:hypothetical protein